MYKQHLLNNIEKEMKICRRLYTKIPADQFNFRPKEGVRSILELLQYLTIVGTAMLIYWVKEPDSHFGDFFGAKVMASKEVLPENFITLMNEQIQIVHQLFNGISEEDL